MIQAVDSQNITTIKMQNAHYTSQGQVPSEALKANGRQCQAFNIQYKLSPLFPTYISQKKLYFRPFSFQKRPETYVGKQTNNPSAPPHEGVVAGTKGPEFLDHVQGNIRICGGLRDLERHWPLCIHLRICADQTRQ